MEDPLVIASIGIVGMLVLTLVVWLHMYTLRLRYVFSHGIAAQRLSTPEKGVELLPESVNRPSNNLKNLFELPVVFYALCLYLYVTGNVDATYVASAWLFLGLRVVHSAIHCTVNVVMLRFTVYMLGALVLWFMVLRAAVEFIK